jgi:hypothetical protein
MLAVGFMLAFIGAIIMTIYIIVLAFPYLPFIVAAGICMILAGLVILGLGFIKEMYT